MSFDYSIFDTLLEPLFILASDQKVIYCNETAAVVCGLTQRKVQRSRFCDLFTFSEPLEWLSQLESVTDSTPYREVRFTNQDGADGRVQITCREFNKEGEERRWIIFVRDVTLEERLQKKYRAELEQKEGYIDELKKAQAELEKYSKNLEKMVEERTQEIRRLSDQMKALLDSLNQGFFIFNSSGDCQEVTSKACLNVLEGNPAGKKIWDVLGMKPQQVEGFKKWMLTLFAEMLPFEDLSPLGPQNYPHSQGKTISIEYFPLRSSDNKMEGVVVVASDITSLVEARRQAETDRAYANLIIKLIKSKKEISRFVRESQNMLVQMSQALSLPPTQWNREELYRILHTVKGGCASFSVSKTADLCHHAEQLITDMKTESTDLKFQQFKSKADEIQKSFSDFLEETKSILGEKGFSEDRYIELPVNELMEITQKISFWSKGQDLANHLLKTYVMEPIGSFFEPYKELIQSVAEKEGKKLEPLKLVNSDLPVLPEIYSPLMACLVHAFRNSVDHGIETPETRLSKNKSESGTIEVHFAIKSSDRLLIQIIDDGGGVDPEKIRSKLAKKGIPTEDQPDQEVIQHIFDSEFSTKEIVTENSGRGVGMDAIMDAAKKLGGHAWVESQLGVGTQLNIEVPYLKQVGPKPAVFRVA